jgi:hypothetical protein
MGLAGFIFRLADARCEHCDKPFQLRNLQEAESITCDHCGHSHKILGSEEDVSIEYDPTLIKPIDSIRIERTDLMFLIEKRWYSKKARSLLFFAGLWNLIWLSAFAGLMSGEINRSQIPLPTQGQLTFIWIGFALLLWAFRGALNRTELMIKNSKLAVRTVPIDFKPMAIYEVSQIEKIKIWRGHKKTGRPVFRFALDMKLKNGETVRLCPAHDVNEAIYLAKTLEEFLSIEQTPLVVDPLVS